MNINIDMEEIKELADRYSYAVYERNLNFIELVRMEGDYKDSRFRIHLTESKIYEIHYTYWTSENGEEKSEYPMNYQGIEKIMDRDMDKIEDD